MSSIQPRLRLSSTLQLAIPPRIESIATVNVDSPSIIQFNRHGINLLDRIPLSQSTRPSALDFDPITEFFYYTDIGVGFIGRIKYDASLEEVLVQENVQNMYLYWVDAANSTVGRIKTNGSGYEELFSQGAFSGVHSFVLDSYNYFLSRDAEKELMIVNRQNSTQIGTISTTEASTMEGLYYYKSDKPIARKRLELC
ncbi:hypothetical protein HOLleu_10114 [Holothuria leucospilota]|uniref:Uncharacterized protein n=1 Tax=Holothuria leucospilota TaxID=206669 RepID=A0A9Q1CDW4_HOLLE|nr:hypothetical protein HOLleu_10114 [Holothuria leucospilota]